MALKGDKRLKRAGIYCMIKKKKAKPPVYSERKAKE